MSRSQIHITKASGQKVSFSEQKLRASLERSGATESQIDSVVGEVDDFLYDGINTKKIYRKAYEVLRKRSKGNAARYKLKKAIMELGPSGYPFEKFIGAILDQQGFQTRVGVTVPGRCVQHEIDVLADKNGKLVMVECKFHNRPGVKCDVKVPLYIHSRFRDVTMGRTENAETRYSEYEGWIVTNTRFTDDAIRYGTCSGLVMIGWDYPASGSLKERISLTGLHPVTCLSTLNNKEKKLLLGHGVVLCRNIEYNVNLLRGEGVPEGRITKVIDECNELMHELEVPEK